MYMSRLAAIREWTFLKALYEHGFPVPVPYDQSRHTILMSFVDAYPFGQIRELSHTGRVYSNLLNLVVSLAEHGLIHADFNEFNLLIDAEERITLIDFPQMVSTSHPDAREFFERDVGCVVSYFKKRFGYDSGEFPSFFSDVSRDKHIDLDKELAASGHANAGGVTSEQQKEFERYIAGKTDASAKARSAANGNGNEDDDEAAEDDGEEPEEEEDEMDEEQVAASLGVEAADLGGAGAAATLGEDEAEQLRQTLQAQEGVFEQEEAAAAAAAAKKKKSSSSSSSSSSSAKAAKPAAAAAASSSATAAASESKEDAEGSEDEEEEEEEEDPAAEEARRVSRMARKDARRNAVQSKQRMQAARKADEKARKAAERERAANPALKAQWDAEQQAAATAKAVEAARAAAAAPVAVVGGEEEDGSEHDDQDDLEDTRSIAGSTASFALSQLSLGGKGNVLNIKLKPNQVGQKLKSTNKNKGRENVKIHASLKEHM